MAGLSKGEISARHFMNLDADDSFQIPVNFGDESGGGGLLLGADDDFDAALAADESVAQLQLTPTPKRRARPKSRLPVPASARANANATAGPSSVLQRERTRSFTSGIPVPKSAARSLSRPPTQERPKAPPAEKSIKRLSRPPIKWTEPVAATGWSSDGDEHGGPAASPTPAAPREQAQPRASERRLSTQSNVSASTSFNLASTSAFPNIADASAFPALGDVSNIADATNIAANTFANTTQGDGDDDEDDDEALLAQLEAERLQLRAELDRQRALRTAGIRSPAVPMSRVSPTRPRVGSPLRPRVASPPRARRVSSRPASPAAATLALPPSTPEPAPAPAAVPVTSRPPTPAAQEARRASRFVDRGPQYERGEEAQPPPRPPTPPRRQSAQVAPVQPSARASRVLVEPVPQSSSSTSPAETVTQPAVTGRCSSVRKEPSPPAPRRVSSVKEVQVQEGEEELEYVDAPPAPVRAPSPPVRRASRVPQPAPAVEEAPARRASIPNVQVAPIREEATQRRPSVSEPVASERRQSTAGKASRVSVSKAAPRPSVSGARREPVAAAAEEEDAEMDMSMPGGFGDEHPPSRRESVVSRRDSVASRRESAVSRRDSVASRRDSVASRRDSVASRRAPGSAAPVRTYADVFDDDDEMDVSPSKSRLYPTLPNESMRVSPTPRRAVPGGFEDEPMQISPARPGNKQLSPVRASARTSAVYSPLRSQPIRSPAAFSVQRPRRDSRPAYAARVPQLSRPASPEAQYEYAPSRPPTPEPPFARSRPASPQYARSRPASPQYARSRPASPAQRYVPSRPASPEPPFARSRPASPQYARRPPSPHYPQARLASPPTRGRQSARTSTSTSVPRPRSRSFAQQQERVDDMFARRVRDSYQHRGLELSPHATRAGYMAPTAASRSRANSVSAPLDRSRSQSRPGSRAASPAHDRGRGRSQSRAPSPAVSHSRSRPPSPQQPRARSQSRPARPVSRSKPASEVRAPAPAPARRERERGGFAAGTAASRNRAAAPAPKEKVLRERDVNKSKSRERERALAKPVSKPVSKKPAPVDPARAVSARTAPKGILKPKAQPKPNTKERLPPSQFKRELATQKSKPKPKEKGKENEGEGITEVLAKYGEKLLKASGLAWIAQPEPEPQPQPPSRPASSKRPALPVLPPRERSADEADESSAGEEEHHDPYRPMTLDDLSPRKRRQAMGPLESPMRPGYKRSSDDTVSPVSEREYKRARPPPSSRTPSPSSSHRFEEEERRPPSRAATRREDPPRPASRSNSRYDEPARSRATSRSDSRAVSRSDRSRPESRALEASWDAPGHANRQRVLEKLELDRLRKELEAQARAGFVPDYAIAPAPPPVLPRAKPTTTQPFTFASDARARREEFEAKRALWQQRESESVGAGSSTASSRSRSLRANPTVGVAPQLSTGTRARERERFDAGVRQRERTVDAYRAERRAARAAEEEREYREMRKRTVVRAHEVPAWYADAPKTKRTASAAR